MDTQYAYLIGMDCGTTNMKAIALRSDGRVVASDSCESGFISKGKEIRAQDAEELWRRASGIFRHIAEQMGPEAVDHIRGICISCHTVSLLPVDADGNALRPMITYQDSRAGAELAEVVGKIGRETYVRRLGAQPSTSSLPGKLLWFMRHEPQLFARTAHFLQANAYLNFKLTDAFATDRDQALRTQCMDAGSMDWSPLVSQALGIDLARYMPPLHEPTDVIGYVTEAAAEQIGFRAGIPVVAGCSDAMAAMYASGMSSMGDATEASGTSSLVFAGSLTQGPLDAAITTRPCPIPGIPWIFDAPIQSTGASIRWFIDHMAAQEKAEAKERGQNIYDYLNDLALSARPGSDGLLFFPYLMGERAPLWNDHACGMFIGLRPDTTRGDMIRAVFEGTAFALAHVMQTIRGDGAIANSLRVCGGGAKSRTWNQIKASVLNMPVHVIAETSGDVPVGDALLVGNSVGVFPDLAKASKMAIHVQEVIEPNPDWVWLYQRQFPFFVKMYRDLDADLQDYLAFLRSLTSDQKT